MEDEALRILRAALADETSNERDLADAIHKIPLGIMMLPSGSDAPPSRRRPTRCLWMTLAAGFCLSAAMPRIRTLASPRYGDAQGAKGRGGGCAARLTRISPAFRPKILACSTKS